MYTSARVRRYIFKLDSEVIFSTRELLNFGRRSAVDKCLSRLVKKGEITRLARGLFKRLSSNAPSAFAVAQHKAQAFNKQIIFNAKIAAEILQSSVNESNPNLFDKYLNLSTQSDDNFSYSTVGHSSKFLFGKNIIYVQGISARKMILAKSIIGLPMIALWFSGKTNCNQAMIINALRSFTKQERLAMRQSLHLLPTWLVDLLPAF